MIFPTLLRNSVRRRLFVPSPLAYTSATVATETTTVSSLTTGSLSPPANAIVAVGYMHRGGTTERTHNVPTAGFATVAGFSALGTQLAPQGSDGQTNHLRASWFVGTTTASPGSGTVQCSANNTNFQQVVWVVYIEHSTAQPGLAAAVTTGASSLAATFSPTVGATHQRWLGVYALNGTEIGSWGGGNGVTHVASSPYALTGAFAIGSGVGVPTTSAISMGGTAATRQAILLAINFEGLAP